VQRAAPKAVVRRPSAAKAPAGKLPEGGGKILPIDIDPARVEEALGKVVSELKHWANKGRYTRVRFKFRGKPLLPDLPLGAVVAAEGMTFYWGGILRALVFNLAGKSMFEVELINDSQKKVQQGKDALLSGDVEQALKKFEEAIAMERDNPQAHLNVGVALRLKGDTGGARAAFKRAKALDAEGPVGAEAERLLATLPVAAERMPFAVE
jgi:tetratricopeptide (TPR) repeat protein